MARLTASTQGYGSFREAGKLALVLLLTAAAAAGQTRLKGILLEELTWVEAEQALTRQTVVVIPLGAASKEHGPHLKLKNDLILAEHLKKRVLDRADVVIAPTVTYHFYPAFLEYPGSTSLRLETARDVIVDICRGLSRFGPRRFYVLNTGVSTVRALQPAAEELANSGIVMRFTELSTVLAAAEKGIGRTEVGTHAGEVETSMILFMDPASVDMRKAVREDNPRGEGGLSRDPKGKGTFSASGVWGDATRATREKGETLVRAWEEGVLKEIEALRQALLPEVRR